MNVYGIPLTDTQQKNQIGSLFGYSCVDQSSFAFFSSHEVDWRQKEIETRAQKQWHRHRRRHRNRTLHSTHKYEILMECSSWQSLGFHFAGYCFSSSLVWIVNKTTSFPTDFSAVDLIYAFKCTGANRTKWFLIKWLTQEPLFKASKLFNVLEIKRQWMVLFWEIIQSIISWSMGRKKIQFIFSKRITFKIPEMWKLQHHFTNECPLHIYMIIVNIYIDISSCACHHFRKGIRQFQSNCKTQNPSRCKCKWSGHWMHWF